MFSLKAADFISTNPACNLLQLSKQPCSTGSLAQLWKPTGLICVLPLTGPAWVPFFEVYLLPQNDGPMGPGGLPLALDPSSPFPL